LKRLLFALCLSSLAFTAQNAAGQARDTAERKADLQLGFGYSNAASDYQVPTATGSTTPEPRFNGFAFYSAMDFKPHYGVEFNIHQLYSGNNDQVHERSYEWGFRYHRTYKQRLNPYLRLMYGRGVFNFPQGEANLAYNLLIAGIGLDYAFKPQINLRVDYEGEIWYGFPPSGLAPQVLTFGVAYHLPGGLKRGQHF
jgi:hypothetical protein